MAGTEGFVRDVQRLEAYLYADDGLLVLTQTACLKWYFDALAEMFDRVGLHNNVAKMVSTAFRYHQQKLRCLWIEC